MEYGLMEISAPKPKFAPTKSHKPYENLPSLTSNPSIHYNLPLFRPQYKPPQPIRIKQPEKSSGKPISTTTSDVLRLMDSLKLPIPSDVYASLIKECTRSGDPVRAAELHQHSRRSGVRLGLPLLNRILLMYISSGCFERARQLFDEMFVRDLNSWAVVIAGCVENGDYGEALQLFVKMLREGKCGNFFECQVRNSVAGILVCVLKACLYKSDIEIGAQVHGWLWKMGYSRNAALSSCLISFYGKLKCFEGGESVFEQVSCRNTAVWTSRIGNYCSDDDFKGAIKAFKEMGMKGVRKNGYTFSVVLKACGRIVDVGCGEQVHASVIKVGLELNDYVQCALVDFYGRCSHLNDAMRVFEISGARRNNACCNAMVMSYVRHGRCIEAIRILEEMKVVGYTPRDSVFDELRLVCGGGVFWDKV